MSILPATSIDDFLGATPPFNELQAADLDWLRPRLEAIEIAAETALAGPALGEATHLHILRQGSVRVVETQVANPLPSDGFMLSPGECFPIGALSGRRPPGNTYIAAEDCLFLRLPVADFDALLERSAVFTRYCNHYLSSLVSQSRRQLHDYFSQRTSEQQTYSIELRQLVRRAPISAASTDRLADVLETMGRQRVGSVVITDRERRPLGIFTRSDVLRRVVLGKAHMAGEVAFVMTPDPACLPETATVFDAMMLMAERTIRHVLLIDDGGHLTGVVSERDLFALQRQGPTHLRQSIASAPDVERLRQALSEARRSAFGMVAQGVAAEQLTRYISSLNDAATRRVLELNLARHDLADIAWTWLCFGSEGREEQTLVTDQDNGILFVAEEAAREATRERLLAFARDANRDLDTCGFPLCKGEIMAGNPLWCLTLAEWRERFSGWIRTPQPEALLNATIFFDFRALHGRADLAGQLHDHLLEQTRDNALFRRMLAENALTVVPPLGLIRDFSVETDESGRAYIDLKASGARLFVDGARVIALTNGIAAPATLRRLRAGSGISHGLGREAEAMADAFNVIQLLRLRHQHAEIEQGRPASNRVYLDRLNELDRRILKEAFRQAKRLQQYLKLNYQL